MAELSVADDATRVAVGMEASKGSGIGAPTRPALRLVGVTKHYKGGGGVTDLTVDVAAGEVFGFLGPNGAGKSTTIRLILDLLRPQAGRIEVLGFDAQRDSLEVRRRVGYLPGELALYERLTVRELLTHLAHLRGQGGRRAAGFEALAERFDLALDRPIRSLSRGNKQKVGLVQALMGRPELVILDEPTSGLDPLVQHEVHEVIGELAADGRTVLLSSHVLSEVAQVADRVGIIRAGRLVTTESVAGLRARALHLLTATFAEPLPPDAFADVTGVRRAEVDGVHVRLELAGSMDPVVKAIAAYPLVELTVHEPDLEDIFLAFYHDSPEGEDVPKRP